MSSDFKILTKLLVLQPYYVIVHRGYYLTRLTSYYLKIKEVCESYKTSPDSHLFFVFFDKKKILKSKYICDEVFSFWNKYICINYFTNVKGHNVLQWQWHGRPNKSMFYFLSIDFSLPRHVMAIRRLISVLLPLWIQYYKIYTSYRVRSIIILYSFALSVKFVAHFLVFCFPMIICKNRIQNFQNTVIKFPYT